MSGFYHDVYERFPEFLKRRIHPLEYAVRDFVSQASNEEFLGRVLDAGAGEGRFRSYFPPDSYIGVDSVVGEPSWDYSQLDVQGDLLALPFAREIADLVLNLQVLEHVRRPGAVLRELHRVLEKGGKLYLSAPQGWHEHQAPHDFYRFTRFALQLMLEEAGFEQIEIEPMGGYFHYLGHRLTYIPKTLFQGRRGLPRILFFPLELISLVLFCFLTPILCYYLDYLDCRKEFTLCYRCIAVK